MSPEHLRRISELLDQALLLDRAEQAAWLDRLDTEDAGLGATLRRLLARQAAKETDGLLDRMPAFALPSEDRLVAGDSIGPYQLISELGVGGMGTVWLAERADASLSRRVALKLPHGSWAPGLAERFAREREILSSLEHPHIARLYDAGVDRSGRPYMALEYVDGQAIDRFCIERDLPTAGRLRLLLQVADAVAFAHSRLVVHRDLKPGNILITGEGEVRLLDFGIAKLLVGDRVGETALTRLAGRVLTLDYASPEQIRGEPIGTASDVYSLGVVAFEVLVGVRPYRLKRGSVAELEEAIVAGEIPVASDVAERPALKRQLRGDLDAVLNKALKKAAGERYATVDAFAADLRRWLQGEPVSAQPDRLAYRARKFLARHRVAVAAGTLVGAALLTASAVSIWQTSVARREARTAKAVETFLRDIFSTNSSQQPDPEQARRTTARELLDIGAKRVDSALADAPDARARVLDTLAQMYVDLTLFDQALVLRRERVAVLRGRSGESAALAAALSDEGSMATQAGDPGAKQALDQALTMFERLGDVDSVERGILEERIAYALKLQRQPGAVEHAQRAVAIQRRHPPSRHLIDALLRHSFIASEEGAIESSVLDIREALQIAEALGDSGASKISELYLELGRLQAMRFELAAAEESLRRALAHSMRREGPDSIETLNMAIDLAQRLYDDGEFLRALEVLRPAGEAAERRIARGDTTWIPALAIVYRGAARVKSGALEAGVQDLDRMLVSGDALRSNPPVHTYLLLLRAEALTVQGQQQAAAADIHAVEGLVAANPEERDRRLIAGAWLLLAIARGDAAAIGPLVSSLELDRAASNERVDATARRGVRLAEARLGAGDPDAALEAAIRTREAILASPNRAYQGDRERRAAVVEAKVHLLRHQPAEAIPLLRGALALSAGRLDPQTSPEHADVLVALASALLDTGARGEALQLAAEAQAIQDRHRRLGSQWRSPLDALLVRLGKPVARIDR